MDKTVNQKAWFLVLPVSGAGRLLGDHPADDRGQLLGPGHLSGTTSSSGSGSSGSRRCLTLDRLWDARCWRQFLFSAIILAIEIPLGMVLSR